MARAFDLFVTSEDQENGTDQNPKRDAEPVTSSNRLQ